MPDVKRALAVGLVGVLMVAGTGRVSATVPMKVMQQYALARNALLAEMKKPCTTVPAIDEIQAQMDAAIEAMRAAFRAVREQYWASQQKDGPGHPSAETKRYKKDMDELLALIQDLYNLFWDLRFKRPRCPPPDPPPPPPPNPEPAKPPAPKPPPKPPGAVSATPTHRTTTCPRCQALADALNETSDFLLDAQARNAPNQSQILVEIQRLGQELNACEKACNAHGTAAMMARPPVIGGLAGGAVLAGILVSRGGGSEPATGGSPSGPSFFPFAGTMTGTMSLVSDAKTCAGSSATYLEKATIALDRSGAGTVQLEAAFARVYRAVLGNNSFTDNETFTYLGQPVPSTASGTFTFASASAGTLTLQETTNWGSGAGACTNVYRGTLR